MFTGSLSDGTKAIPIYDAWVERRNVQSQGTPTASPLSKDTSLPLHLCNSFSDSDEGARGYVLVLREDLDTLNLNARYTLTFSVDTPVASSLAWKGLVICREP